MSTFGKRVSITLLACAGVASAVIFSPTGATAADEGDINACGSDCKDWNYTQSKGNAYIGQKQVLGPKVQTCPGDAPSTASASSTKTIGHDWSWTIGGGANNAFMGAMAAYGQSTSESVSTTTGANSPVPAGQIGNMVFFPDMYYSEGTMTWTEYMFDEFHTTLQWQANVRSDTPLTIGGGGASGAYDIDYWEMNANELATFCG